MSKDVGPVWVRRKAGSVTVGEVVRGVGRVDSIEDHDGLTVTLRGTEVDDTKRVKEIGTNVLVQVQMFSLGF